MRTRIVSDSSCDIRELDGIEFAAVPLTISTDEKTFVDDDSLNIPEMLDYLASYKSVSRTACPGISAWISAFDEADEIFVVTMTSGLSGTYNSALNAKNIYLEDHPSAKIFVIDTLSTSSEQLLIIEKIAEMVKAGTDFESICDSIMKYKETTKLFFCLKSLHNFSQNGRVPKILAQAIGVMGIAILGVPSSEGTVSPIAKCRNHQIVSTVIKEMKKRGYNGGKVNVAHVENPEQAESFVTALKAEFPNVEVKSYCTKGLCAYYAEKGGLLVGCELSA